MKALVLSGGGAKGSYQAGVYYGLNQDYDLICGVSVGALNGALIAQFNHHVNARNELHDLWYNLRNESVYKKWFAWPLSLPWKRSVYDSRPLHNLVRKNISKDGFKKRFICGAVSYNTGMYGLWDNKSDEIVDAVIASSAFPAMLSPKRIKGRWYIDGGVVDVTPLGAAIDAGATDIDVILPSYRELGKLGNDFKFWNVGIRSLDIMMDEIIRNDIKLCRAYNHVPGKKEINLRVVTPRMPLPLSDPLDFDHKGIMKNFDLGFSDGLDLVHPV